MLSLAVHVAGAPFPIIPTLEDEPEDLVLRMPIMAHSLADQLVRISVQAGPQGHPEFPVMEFPHHLGTSEVNGGPSTRPVLHQARNVAQTMAAALVEIWALPGPRRGRGGLWTSFRRTLIPFMRVTHDLIALEGPTP